MSKLSDLFLIAIIGLATAHDYFPKEFFDQNSMFSTLDYDFAKIFDDSKLTKAKRTNFDLSQF